MGGLAGGRAPIAEHHSAGVKVRVKVKGGGFQSAGGSGSREGSSPAWMGPIGHIGRMGQAPDAAHVGSVARFVPLPALS
jgi:hypothetical protein